MLVLAWVPSLPITPSSSPFSIPHSAWLPERAAPLKNWPNAATRCYSATLNERHATIASSHKHTSKRS